MTTTNQQEVFFVVGCPRSGTTLLQACLDRHPEVAMFGETHFMERFHAASSSGDELLARDAYRRLVSRIVETPEFPDFGIEADRFREAADRSPMTTRGAFAALFAAVRSATGKRVVGEKTPGHLRHAETLLGYFPEARFVHLVRDPRAVVNSYRHVPWSSGSVAGDARTWNSWMSQWRNLAPRVRERTLLVRYEDLVNDSEPSLRRVCDWLRVDFSADLLEAGGQQAGVNTELEPWKKGATSSIKPSRTEGWRRELSPLQVATVELICDPWFEAFRYRKVVPGWLSRPILFANHVRRFVLRRLRAAPTVDPAA